LISRPNANPNPHSPKENALHVTTSAPTDLRCEILRKAVLADAVLQAQLLPSRSDSRIAPTCRVTISRGILNPPSSPPLSSQFPLTPQLPPTSFAHPTSHNIIRVLHRNNPEPHPPPKLSPTLHPRQNQKQMKRRRN
jgi:hypothetical protein